HRPGQVGAVAVASPEVAVHVEVQVAAHRQLPRPAEAEEAGAFLARVLLAHIAGSPLTQPAVESEKGLVGSPGQDGILQAGDVTEFGVTPGAAEEQVEGRRTPLIAGTALQSTVPGMAAARDGSAEDAAAAAQQPDTADAAELQAA